MNREALNAVMLAAEKTRNGLPIDFPLLIDKAAGMGPLSWRDAADLALLKQGDAAARSPQLLEFVSELARALEPASVLDPWVTAPTVLAAAHEASGSARSCGLVPDERVWVSARQIAALDWRAGSPLRLLDDLAGERFDFVLADPPFGIKRRVARQPGGPGKLVDVADLVFSQVTPLVADHGAMLFHAIDDFFWTPARRGLWLEMAQRGLYLRAVISVDPALTPALPGLSSLVMFAREARDQLFVGLLERNTDIPVLVRNLMETRNGSDPQLGILTSAESFRGWRPLMLEHELSRMFGSSEMRSLADIGNVRAVQLKPGVPYDPPANCVFVPTIGFGNVLTLPPDLEGKRGYRLLEVQLDPGAALAEYVAGLLSSAPGKQLRQAASSGAGIPHLNVSGAEMLRLPVPPVSAQVETTRSSAYLASMQATVTRLTEELWRRPQDAPRVLAELEASAGADPARRWLETLPYPLASVLQRHTALRGPKERLEALLHFYEATSQFSCAVMLSILLADPGLLAGERSNVTSAAGPDRTLFDRAEFGLWINLGRTLAKSIRRIQGAPELRARLGEAAGPAAELMGRLARKQLWDWLDQARKIRNARAHGGLLTPVEEKAWTGSLESLLSSVEQALASGFDTIDLARVDQGRLASGLYVYPRAQRLRGPSSVFEEFELRARVPVESGHLAFVGRDDDISSVLMLAPLVRMGGTTRSSRNASYFFNRKIEGGKFAYVSYHFEDEPTIEINEPELQKIALDLRESSA